ncbi:hypothetical protein [Halocynthiibacter styelae]|uniref:Uncharacterized protein n=1 Tax=Halocynthiibacter styelae TaxID=2761955 RepID=A0A8J7LK13_9RHOB|nr:hypothetical protein [Paenihalocynthiibacter styelae]MBI1492980.1 hypothetical protein [Paenihalocynthiibacter styelae]
MELRENYLKYLFHMETFYNSYHTQKENAAWKLVVFSGTITVLTFSVFRLMLELKAPAPLMLCVLILPPVFLFRQIIRQAKTQAVLRRAAALMVISCRMCVHDLVTGKPIADTDLVANEEVAASHRRRGVLADEIFDGVPEHLFEAAASYGEQNGFDRHNAPVLSELKTRTIVLMSAFAYFPFFYVIWLAWLSPLWVRLEAGF